jgi:Rieske Fe-S protein
MSCQNCVNRRDFLAKSALAAAALVVADGCGDGQIGAPVRNTVPGGDPNIPVSPALTLKLSDFPGLASAGTLVAVGSERAVIRTGTSTFGAFSMICTHEQCDTDIRNNRFECPCHGSIFAADGSVVRGPVGASGSASPLHKLAVTFDEAKGTITVA